MTISDRLPVVTEDVRFHVGFPSPTIATLPMPEWSAIARHCDELGFDTLWHSNERFYREMWVRMTISALVTERIRLGGAVVEPYAVHPAVTAQALATLAELSNGRADLAIGAGGSGFPMMGIQRSKSALAISEALEVIRPLLGGETVEFDGKTVRAHGARLHLPPAPEARLWVASRGELTLQRAAARADGIMLATYAVEEDVRRLLAVVERGASSVGRPLRDLRLMSRVDTCVYDDAEVAREASRTMVAKFLWASYPNRRFVEEAGLQVPPELEAIIATRDYDGVEPASHLVPDALVDRFCWAGDAEQVAARVASVIANTPIREVGFWVLLAPGQTLEAALETLATDVVPRVTKALDHHRKEI